MILCHPFSSGFTYPCSLMTPRFVSHLLKVHFSHFQFYTWMFYQVSDLKFQNNIHFFGFFFFFFFFLLLSFLLLLPYLSRFPRLKNPRLSLISTTLLHPLPDPGIEPRSPALQADALTSEPPGKPLLCPTSSYLPDFVCSILTVSFRSHCTTDLLFD